MINGADGYVLKDIETDELILTIKSISKGLRVIHREAFNSVVRKFTSPESPNRYSKQDYIHDLTKRESDIIRLIVYGKSNKEIAVDLSLSAGSVRNTISAILAKLHLKDRTQLAIFAVKNNYV